MPWEGIDQAIIHSQGVKMHKSQDILEKGLHRVAVSGACATIASDALMNPFDGERMSLYLIGYF